MTEEISYSFVYGLVYRKHRITMFIKVQKEATHIPSHALPMLFLCTIVDANASKSDVNAI
jgi:hypothetical protein